MAPDTGAQKRGETCARLEHSPGLSPAAHQVESRLTLHFALHVCIDGSFKVSSVIQLDNDVSDFPSEASSLENESFSAALADQRLLEAIDALPEGIVFLDSEGRYRLWNKRYAEIYRGSADLFRVGAKLEDTLRIGVYRGQYPEAIGREEAWLSERLAKLREPGSRHEQRLADGRWILIEERRTSDGGAIGIRVDITDLKEAEAAAMEARERAEAANRAKSVFLANMSHEVRTPLNGVLGLAQVLLRTELDPRQQELIKSILSSASSLDRILCDVLDLSRAESGRLEIREEVFDLHELVSQVGAFFASQASDKGLTFTVRTEDSVSRRVVGDADRLRQVLWNIVCNALKFTAKGAIEVTVSGEEEAGFHRFQVRDTGIGFPPEDGERLFQRFEQADGSITRKHGGSGLGLAICRELVQLMGGTIAAASQPGLGSVFTVRLPMRAACAPPDEQTAGIQLARRQGVVPRLLVAEDNAVNRKVVELALGAAGEFCIDSANNGREAVDMAASGGYDLILMDVQMPVMDGLSATRAIRAREAATGEKRTPIAVLSANVMAEDVDAARRAGADAHLGKPFDLAELVSTVFAMIEPDYGASREATRIAG